ncbi:MULTISPECIES: TonB-dependent receptor [Rhodanobacter]|uniref:TonB-dependent receptor n=1 Tax=Rhodanobacter TaxID=75309 RepID=UPI0004088521|nr:MULTISPECIES: TonB-dependent receptor [Rhodanobacter]KZC18776.1 TonB-dependent receptor [Rhodanobacter denitrificans]UJJ51336.1 TonB-dependent receptor [Rhodanobacter denitrificans]UJM94083.1 TonB-dependent receptor [Rhodanobacter denitrificans]UJM97612.1 TonB-dependent receptor [Rhodanobacter denitrificans]UJN22973.1 TonB-dependent receptor [Rhodanobacter denitrificans]
MKPSLLAASLAIALGTSAVHATDVPPPTSAATPVAAANADDPTDGGNRNRQPVKVQDLGAVSVSAALDQARNGLSPDTGSSQYVIDQKAIAQLPLGASTPVNQVLLQAPGVVQDSYGGVHVRGDHANLQYRINGVIIPESIGGFGQSLDARTIRTVKLLDGALPAQYGLRTAAVVDITTKSGSELGNGGSVGITGGSNGTLNPNASVWGSNERWSWFLTGNYLENDAGIENPTPGKKPIHDHTNQAKGFGDISYLIDNDTRLSFLFGVANNRFQIPNQPGLQPQFGYLGQVGFDSAQLDGRQRENTRFGVLALQGKLGATDYQVSVGQRYSSLAYSPDRIGELMFNGVASAVSRSNRASTLQADFSTPLGDRHTLRYGIYGSFERAISGNNAWVFPADAGGNQTSTTPINILDGSRLVAKTWSAYVQDEWSIGDDWTLNYGLRGDRYQLVRSESQLSPRLGLVWQATGSTTVHAGYSRYFTPPATEMIASSNIAKFDGTTNAVSDMGNNTPLAERSDYFDAGISQNIGSAWTVGVDAYYRKVRRLQDEGQFGSALVYSTFNYEAGRVKGVEFTANYEQGPLSAWFNASLGKAIGKRIVTSQYNFAPDDLAWVNNHWIFLDHDQKLTSSGGIHYALNDSTGVGADYLFGSGLRKDGDVPNGASLPAYFQLNLNLSHDFAFDRFGKLHTQLAVLNVLDRTYELRDGSGIGVGAPQFGPRRGVYLSLQKDF